jgi:hypothetical protein
MNPRKLAAEGERRRDIGMNRAAARRPDRVTLGRLAFVSALLRSPIGVASIDDATGPDDLATGFADGGRWRGTVTRTLIADGLAELIGTTRSIRPSRHRGWVALLRLVDQDKARDYLRRMNAALAAYETTPPVAADGVAMPDTTKTTDQGDLRDDKVI